ncbi:MAG: hypothetical protein H6835_09595 [Planctomycetes bacterium]|nr:hypothetical protein [Planctomycetota bacterium]
MRSTPPHRFAAVFAAGMALVCTIAPVAAQLPPSVREVQLRVLDAKGGPIQDVRVRVCGVVAKNERFTALPGQDWRTLQPKDFAGDHAKLSELPDGEPVLFVEADHGALTVSKKFELPARKPIQLTVHLQEGLTLTGTVTTPDGAPVAGAEVRTLDPDEENQHPFVRAIGAMLVAPLTRTCGSAACARRRVRRRPTSAAAAAPSPPSTRSPMARRASPARRPRAAAPRAHADRSPRRAPRPDAPAAQPVAAASRTPPRRRAPRTPCTHDRQRALAAAAPPG